MISPMAIAFVRKDLLVHGSNDSELGQQDSRYGDFSIIPKS